MQRYFSRVIAAEEQTFGKPRFLPANVRQLPVKMGDASALALENLEAALAADVIVVFGASFLRGALCDRLIARRAVNIHMGVSPYYRGSSTNFWAMYDRRPQFVGATIHLLSKGLDSGDMLFHAFPADSQIDPFLYGMRAVRAAQEGLARHIEAVDLFDLPAVPQNRTLELRYTRNSDFTDAVAADYLSRVPSPAELGQQLGKRDLSSFIRPFLG
jgi:methionyl-tRNA formyltransferase